MTGLGVNGLIQMIVTIGMIIFCWQIFKNIKFEVMFSKPSPIEARMLRLFAAVLTGYGVSSFFFDYLAWTAGLRFIGAD